MEYLKPVYKKYDNFEEFIVNGVDGLRLARLDGPSYAYNNDSDLWARGFGLRRIDAPCSTKPHSFQMESRRQRESLFHTETLKLGSITQFIDIDCRLDILTLE